MRGEGLVAPDVRRDRVEPRPRRKKRGEERANQLIRRSSTSNWSVELGGITGGKPRTP